jgi:hypothetical protein
VVCGWRCARRMKDQLGEESRAWGEPEKELL